MTRCSGATKICECEELFVWHRDPLLGYEHRQIGKCKAVETREVCKVLTAA